MADCNRRPADGSKQRMPSDDGIVIVKEVRNSRNTVEEWGQEDMLRRLREALRASGPIRL